MNTLRMLIAALLLFPMAAAGVIEVHEFESAEQQQRFEELTSELRCPKCQNQNIAASDAPIAQDMRERVYQRIQAGDSDQEILQAMVERFGDFVHYRPPLTGSTVLLWFGPLFLAVVGLVVILVIVRRSRRADEPALSPDERARIEALLDSERSSDAGQSRS